jgi:hypothetical protein
MTNERSLKRELSGFICHSNVFRPRSARETYKRDLQGFAAGFAGADTDRFYEVGNEDLAVADLTGLSDFDNRVHSRLQLAAVDGKFEFNLGYEVDPKLCPS